MTPTDKINLLTAIATAVNTVVVALGLIFLYIQSRAVLKGLRQSSIQADRAHMFDINRLLMDDAELRKLFGLESDEVLGYMLFNDFETMYLDYKDGILPKRYWKAKEALIKQTVNLGWMKAFWSRILQHSSATYGEDFIKLMEQLMKDHPVPTKGPTLVLPINYRRVR